MRKFLFFLCVLIFSCATTQTEKAPKPQDNKPTPPVSTIKSEDLTGSWEGKLTINTIQLRIVFNIKSDAGKLSATMDSPDQGAFDIPVTEIKLGEGKKLTLIVQSIAGTYEGELQTPDFIKGEWKQMNQVFLLDIKKHVQPVSYTRPQDPVPPFPYQAQEVTFRNEKAGITLAGTLTYPQNDKPLTTVILISGSGSQNRNEEVMGHRPFLVLADHLSRNGIAVLRYDDRGIGGSGGDPLTATSFDYATDVQAAIAYLKTQQWIKTGKIGLIGHSEGGMIAPIAAKDSKDVDFIVLMAGPGCSGKDILIQQTAAIMRASGSDEKVIQETMIQNTALYNAIAEINDPAALKAKVEELLVSYGLPEDKINETVAILTNPWFVYFVKLDPAPLLEGIRIPVLAINGSLDLQVLPQENLAAIDKALQKAGNKHYTIKEFPGLNHLFQTSTTGLMMEYNIIEETIAPDVLSFISSWINGLK